MDNLENTICPRYGDMKTFRDVINDARKDLDFKWLTIIGSGRADSFTYRDLLERVHDYLHFFKTNQVKEGDTVLIILKESLDLFASFFAGVVYGALPAYYAYPSPKHSEEYFFESISDLIKYNEVKVVISFPEVIGLLKAKAKIFRKEDESYFNCMEIPRRNSTDIDFCKLPTREAFLQFSSGTTGAKKGIKISVGALFNQIENYSPHIGFNKKSKVVSWLPHYHDMGLVACMLMPFIEKVPIYMFSPFEWVKNPRLLLEIVAEQKGTHLWLPNFALGHLMKTITDGEACEYDLSSVEKLVCCSEPVLYETVDKFLKKFSPSGLNDNVLCNCYAMAENTFAVTSSEGGKLRFMDIDYETFTREHRIKPKQGGFKIASTGRALSSVKVKIIDEKGVEVENNRVGEIAINSDCMAEEYHNNTELTERSFVGGWFRTGDLGFINNEELYITGRNKDIIIVGGENIYPQDIEQILNEEESLIPGRNVVFGIKDDRIGTERVVALVEAHPENRGKMNTVDIISKVFNKLNLSLSEVHILPHKALKKSTAGKISRYLNKLEFQIGGFEKYVDKVQTCHDEIKALVLSVAPGIEHMDIEEDTPLISTGIIDSFGFVELISGIEQKFGVKIPADLYKPYLFQTISVIKKTVEQIKQKGTFIMPDFGDVRKESLERLLEQIGARGRDSKMTMREFVINNFPFPRIFLYRWFLRINGIKVGKNVRFLGRTNFKVRGKASNIIISDNVVIGKNVELRNRENGKIVLGEGTYLDTGVRIVSAREGKVELDKGSAIGAFSIINSGGSIDIGKFVLIGGNVNINSSSHGILKKSFVCDQGYQHGKVKIENDVWIGNNASILIDSEIGEGAVIASNTLVNGRIPSYAVCAGIPAKIIKYRD